MSKARTATAILEARGAFARNPQRKRKDPEVKGDFPDVAPANLTPIQVKAWWELVRQIPCGVLTSADQATVRLCAVLWAEFLVDAAGMQTARITQLRNVMGDLGLSPAARAKLATRPEDDDGDF